MQERISAEMKRLNLLLSEIDAAYHDAALKLGLSDSAMLVLYAVCSAGGACPLQEITNQSGVSKQTINSALRKLEGEDVVYLEALRGRAKRVCLTEKGKALAEHTVLRLIAIENTIVGDWTQRERALYLDLTQRYLSAFKAKIKELSL